MSGFVLLLATCLVTSPPIAKPDVGKGWWQNGTCTWEQVICQSFGDYSKPVTRIAYGCPAARAGLILSLASWEKTKGTLVTSKANNYYLDTEVSRLRSKLDESMNAFKMQAYINKEVLKDNNQVLRNCLTDNDNLQKVLDSKVSKSYSLIGVSTALIIGGTIGWFINKGMN